MPQEVDLTRKPRLRLFTATGLLLVGVILALDYSLKQIGNALKTPKAEPSQSDSSPAHRFYSKEFHHGFAPRTSGIEQYGPFQAQYFINSMGMRDQAVRNISMEVKGKRILLMGDSYVDGVGLPFEKTVAGQLSPMISGLEVLNGGVASYCPSLIRDRLRVWVDRQQLRFDLLVAFIDISDLENELCYIKDQNGNYQKNCSEEFASFREINIAADQKFRRLLVRSVEKNFVVLGAVVRNLRIAYQEAGCPGGTMEWDYADWPAYQGPLEPWIRKSLEKQSEAMDEVASLCRGQGAGLAVVVYPWLQQVRRGHGEDRHTLFWQKWCESRQVPFLNLYPDFLSVRKEIREYVLADEDSHWGDRGCQLVARRLVDLLKQSGILSSASSS